MMYRSGWATKDGQERVLAAQIRRALFDRIHVTPLVHEQRGKPRDALLTPSERAYPVADPATRRRLGLNAA